MSTCTIDCLVKTLESRNMEIVRNIGHGSFGNIFLSRDIDSKEEVAVKQYPNEHTYKRFFLKEVCFIWTK